jgi:ribonuclease D
VNSRIFEEDLPEGFTINGDLAVDTEAMGLKIKRDRLCTVQISNGDGEAYIVKFGGARYDAPNLKKLLTDESRVKIFHFARFDITIMRHYLGIVFDNIFCTKIASRLARTYTDYHSLKELCREILGISLPKQVTSSYWGAQILSNDQIKYAASDVLHLHSLRDRLSQMLIREKRMEMADKLFKFLPTIAEIDLRGWGDVDIFAHH